MLEPTYDSGIYNHCQYDEPPIDYSDDGDDEDSSTEIIEQKKMNESDDLVNNFDSTSMPIINFNYLLFEKLIGQGGFGKVHRGKFHHLIVAIKEPIYYNQDSINVINKSIVEEARLHYSLNHPNIIELYGISIKHNKIYLVMEYAHGRSLRELLTKRALSPNIIIKFAIQISSAMEYLHNFKPKPIIHRDLKSLNILLNEPINDGKWSTKQIKLTDLGLAREFTNSASMTQCGTYAWMAPESIIHSKFSKASDVWSFGVVLWELLTGQIPYKNVSGAAVAFGIGNRKLTLPIPKTCPEELKCILQECWYQNPKFRPSFKKIRKDLEQSSFNVINMEQFQKMKKNWFEEIETIWKNLKEKEKELEFREEKAKLKEEEAKRKQQEIERMEQFLLQQSKELKRREIEVVGRELNVLLQQQQPKQNIDHNNCHKSKKRTLKKKILSSSGNPRIGYPENFCHNLTVTTTSQEDNKLLPSLQARALNQTWTPGTKVRQELHVDLFNASRSSSTSQDLHDKEREEECNAVTNNKKTLKMRKKKKISVFLRNFFKSSKSNINKESSDSYKNQTMNDQEMTIRNELKFSASKPPHIFSPNRTYHGQTKHSERQKINLHEHFLYHSFNSSESDLENDHQSYSSTNDDDDENNNNSSNGNITYQTIVGEVYHYLVRNSNEYFDEMKKNENDNHHYCENVLNENIIYDSEKALADEDLLKEISIFEQEFQSMHCA